MILILRKSRGKWRRSKIEIGADPKGDPVGRRDTYQARSRGKIALDCSTSLSPPSSAFLFHFVFTSNKRTPAVNGIGNAPKLPAVFKEMGFLVRRARIPKIRVREKPPLIPLFFLTPPSPPPPPPPAAEDNSTRCRDITARNSI